MAWWARLSDAEKLSLALVVVSALYVVVTWLIARRTGEAAKAARDSAAAARSSGNASRRPLGIVVTPGDRSPRGVLLLSFGTTIAPLSFVSHSSDSCSTPGVREGRSRWRVTCSCQALRAQGPSGPE